MPGFQDALAQPPAPSFLPSPGAGLLSSSPGPSRAGCVAEGDRPHPAPPDPGPYDALVRCAQAGEPGAFRRVAETFGPPLQRYVASMLRDRDAAEDVVQETLVIAWRQIDKVRDGDHLRPWLYRVARNKAISVIRRRLGPSRVLSLEVSDRNAELAAPILTHNSLTDGPSIHGPSIHGPSIHGPSIHGPATHADANLTDLQRALQIAIARLPDRYASIVRLHYVHGYTTREAGRVLGVKRSTAKMRLLRARQLLGQYLPQAVATVGGRARRELADWVERRTHLSRAGPCHTAPRMQNAHQNHEDRTSGGDNRPR